MPQYRKKPVVVEAEQYLGLQETVLPNGVLTEYDLTHGLRGFVTTIHLQKVYLEPGDWILPEPDGIHYYPVKDKIFKNIYEPV